MFYIVVNNNATEYHFDYLKDSPMQNRIDPTLVNGIPKESKLIEPKFHKVFAIDLMSKEILSLKTTDTFLDVKKILSSHSIHHIPVIDKEKLMGLITTTRLQAKGKIEDKIEVKELMEETVLCAHEDTPLEHILKIFINEKIHSILLLNKDLDVSGILTQNDVFKWVLKSRI
ncbi:MAG: hypothetical protein BM556_16125 [Bacteriovorax sp. MedPE-SWde]|nr:MAG: hypothetical protein BM556_16125 [Bacteriovorax sp. MedPE-SWde]